jgi:hypothetical protein
MLGVAGLLLALAIAVALFATSWSLPPSAARQRAWSDELRQLEFEQDSLRSRSVELFVQDDQVQKMPQGEVVIAVPTVFVREAIERVFEDVASRITLRLSGIKVHKAKKVKKVVTLGEFAVDVDMGQVVGRIRPRKPNLTFGNDQVLLDLPVSVSEGAGEATIHFAWDSKNVADLVCGDLEVTRTLTGTVIPGDYLISGSLKLEKQGRRVIATPRFPDSRVRIRVKPSQAAWDSLNAILDEKRGVCGFVLDKVDVPEILRNVTEEKGFNVRLPVHKLRPAIVPAGISDSVTVGGRTLAIEAETNTVRIDSDAIWYSATVRIEPAQKQAAPGVRRGAPDSSP